jgi:archaellum component FlaC
LQAAEKFQSESIVEEVRREVEEVRREVEEVRRELKMFPPVPKAEPKWPEPPSRLQRI